MTLCPRCGYSRIYCKCTSKEMHKFVSELEQQLAAATARAERLAGAIRKLFNKQNPHLGAYYFLAVSEDEVRSKSVEIMLDAALAEEKA